MIFIVFFIKFFFKASLKIPNPYMEFMHKVNGVIVVDNEDNRVFAKYYVPEFTDPKRQRILEKAVMAKILAAAGVVKTTDGSPPVASTASDGNILLYEGYAVVYKTDADITMMVFGSIDENEVVLYSVLTCIYESLQTLLKCSGAIDKRLLLESYDALVLVIDEVIDDGIIMEVNSSNVCPDVQPYFTERSENPLNALITINKYLKQNL